MTRINFGISSASQYTPGIPLEERVMEISGKESTLSRAEDYLDINEVNPEKREIRNYSDARENKYTKLPAIVSRMLNISGGGPPVISFGMKNVGHHYYEMYLIWIKEDNKWIAVIHSEWTETDLHIDENEWGPFALDEYCKKVLAMFYRVDRTDLSEDISKISPDELKRKGRIKCVRKLVLLLKKLNQLKQLIPIVVNSLPI